MVTVLEYHRMLSLSVVQELKRCAVDDLEIGRIQKFNTILMSGFSPYRRSSEIR